MPVVWRPSNWNTSLLAGRPAENSATKNMKVQVEDGLARLGVCVYHGAKSRAVDAFLPCHFRRHCQQVSEQVFVQVFFIQGRDVLARDDQQMNGRLGINVLEHNTPIVFVKNGRGFLSSGYLAEYAPDHFHHPLFVSIEDQSLHREGNHCLSGLEYRL